ncbi:uncharacterized protein MELLADRAFT_92031 [Melampsora larici-populina 98AG31]|uniref:Uncharacterized protein n=1 Tax=Melampsora larici-populina (strain 98AG31 / pathotype 3-4-7) TaxID=747676 RepID=F4S1A2_MELLP|nr:uncharacterized protein MELLADRAFT_92031 [Melampsora larici-populina 98AG31]EGG01597.1 hypothetical protein MELLADRAFT_92031 [Melampsora larici-populina 98AG31]
MDATAAFGSRRKQPCLWWRATIRRNLQVFQEWIPVINFHVPQGSPTLDSYSTHRAQRT